MRPADGRSGATPPADCDHAFEWLEEVAEGTGFLSMALFQESKAGTAMLMAVFGGKHRDENASWQLFNFDEHAREVFVS